MCKGVGEKLKILLLTVAGVSSRFCKSIGKTYLKCIYYKNSIKESLLYHMIFEREKFDKYIIVGGFKFDELKEVLKKEFKEYYQKIILIENQYYREYGSCYSLYLGVKAAIEIGADEIVFAEGDLYVDKENFSKVFKSCNNVITYNNIPILANKAVVFYYNYKDKLHYIYDTNHHLLEIKEPFRAIFNSGQIWKFIDIYRLSRVVNEIEKESWKGTNLIIIQSYFDGLSRQQYEMIGFQKWINCNTIEDFNQIEGEDKEYGKIR